MEIFGVKVLGVWSGKMSVLPNFSIFVRRGIYKKLKCSFSVLNLKLDNLA
jgi:hypothetical protein